MEPRRRKKIAVAYCRVANLTKECVQALERDGWEQHAAQVYVLYAKV